MKGQRSGIFKSCDRSRGNQDGEREGKRSAGMVDIQVCQRCTEILRIDKLLSLIY